MHQACSNRDGLIRFPDHKFITIVNSTHGKYPTGSDPWIQQTCEVVSLLSDRKGVLLTSVGSLNWDLLCYLAGQAGLFQRVILPTTRDQFDRKVAEVIHQLEIDPQLTEFQLFEVTRGNLRDYGLERDRFILEQSDQIIPISIRPKGRLESLLQNIRPASRIDASRMILWCPSPTLTIKLPNPELVRKTVDPKLKDWLIHWTRTCQGPWPGERKSAFFKDLLASHSEYPRSGQKTLERILFEMKIRASTWRIHDNQPVVAFSALAPSQALQLMRWRARYVRYSFEPYGIAVHPRRIVDSGIHKVLYVENMKNIPKDVPTFLCQGKGKHGDWPIEREYRHLGDFIFSKVNQDEIQPVDLLEMVEERE